MEPESLWKLAVRKRRCAGRFNIVRCCVDGAYRIPSSTSHISWESVVENP